MEDPDFFKKRKKWTEDDMQKALESIKEGNKIKSAARDFSIPDSTLRDRVKSENKDVNKGNEANDSSEVEQNLSQITEIEIGGVPVFVQVMPNQEPTDNQPTEVHEDDDDDDLLTPRIDKKKMAELEQFLKIEPKRIKCPDCNRYTAENEEKMLRHIRKVHRGENPFQCYMCDYSTYNKSLFEEHVRIHQGIKPYKCSHCPYRSASKKNTKKHEQIHRPDNPLKCTQCDFIGRHQRALDSHRKEHHTEDGVFGSCKICRKTFDNAVAYRNHIKSIKTCSECEFRYCQKKVLRNHMLDHDLTPPQSPQKKSLFKCQVCAWSCNNKPRILLHLIHHPQHTNLPAQDLELLTKWGIELP